MKRAFFSQKISAAELQQALFKWFQGSPGQELLELERATLDRMLNQLFGLYLVAAGYPELVLPSRIRHSVLLGEGEPPSGIAQVRGQLTCMPFQSDSVDVVLLAHALDFSADPHQVLRETDRILIPEGRLILLGFNPFSIWGMRRLVGLQRDRIPWSASFISQGRVCDWLHLLGFDIEVEERLMFRPPLATVSWMRGMRFLEGAGAKLWSPLAAVYVIQAVKRVSTLTPIQPAWKLKEIIKPSIAEPTARRSAMRPFSTKEKP